MKPWIVRTPQCWSTEITCLVTKQTHPSVERPYILVRLCDLTVFCVWLKSPQQRRNQFRKRPWMHGSHQQLPQLSPTHYPLANGVGVGALVYIKAYGVC